VFIQASDEMSAKHDVSGFSSLLCAMHLQEFLPRIINSYLSFLVFTRVRDDQKQQGVECLAKKDYYLHQRPLSIGGSYDVQ